MFSGLGNLNKDFGFYSDSYERTLEGFEPREDRIPLAVVLKISHKEVTARKERCRI